MKVYFRQLSDNIWRMSRFHDGYMIYNFSAEQHNDIHKKITEIFPSATFTSNRNNNRVILENEADAAFFHFWADENGVQI